MVTLMWLGLYAGAQVITTTPETPVDNQALTITFDASQGSKGLIGHTGDVYAHTGVITSESTSDGDWKYVKAGWNENIPECKLTSLGNNKFSLIIGPSIREFYGVPAGEKINKLAFVFRNADGSKEGKTADNKDIFVVVTTTDVTVSIIAPLASGVFKTGSPVPFDVSATNAGSIKVFVDEVEVSVGSGNALQGTFTAGSVGKHTFKAEATDGVTTVSQTVDFFVRSAVANETMPTGLKRGVNVIGNNSVTMVLFAPYKTFVHVIGEFNNWLPNDNYMMKKDGDYFWLTINDLNPDTEYAFQFFIDGQIRIADPYTNKTLDAEDHYIPATVYPNLKEYPTGQTMHAASVFKINEAAYTWNVENFTNPDISKLVIYELHVRDFTANGDIKTVTDSMAYFKRLGVNAIELMPFNEFEGNDSWGYNPSFYFAPDKAYGTANDYKEFIDVCHQNGISVLMDMVLNHSFGQSPFARMYLDGGKPAANNPWYNREHNMLEPAAQWGYDFNHESPHTEALVDSICSFWLQEYKIDGFRFDFTKGFSNKPYPEGDWASAYDQGRINILTRMANEIWKVKADAIVSFEHLSDNDEEKVLANHGILLWGNHNHNFSEATMGYNTSGKSDFSWASYKKRNWNNAHIINYMESHDEERIMYKNIEYGNSSGTYNVKDVKTGLKRSEAAAVFLMSIPGPNMIWQFGELGYDYSINYCMESNENNCRTGRKPIKWDYTENENRMHLFDTYSTIINLKKEEPVFSTTDYSMEVAAATKLIALNHAGSDIRLVGNFDVVQKTLLPKFSSTGYWYNHFDGDSILVNDLNMSYTLQAGEFALFSQKKLNGFAPYVSVGDPAYFNNAHIAPNPVKETLHVFSGDNPLKQIKISSITGVVLMDKKIVTNDASLQVGDYPSGMYLVHLIGANNGYKVFKMIKK